MTLEEKLQEFDDAIEKVEDLHGSYDRLKDYLKSDENTLFEEYPYPETFFELSPEKVKDFIKSVHSSAVEETERKYATNTGGMVSMGWHEKRLEETRKEVVDKFIKYIRQGEISGSFSEGCDCSDCDKYEKKVRKDLIVLLSTLQTNKGEDNKQE